MQSPSDLHARAAGAGHLSAKPLDAVPKFNWLFLLLLIVCGILVLFFLFYFNRLFATVLSYAIRAYTWHYYRIYVDIHSLQISFLGGRIFFKGFRYHGENETVLVQTGYLTWRYWLRSVKPAGIFRDDETNGSQDSGENEAEDPAAKTDRLPCRIEVSLEGLEWFIYNRTAGYNSILAGFPHSDYGYDDNTDDGHSELEHDKRDAKASNDGLDPSSNPNSPDVNSSGNEKQERPNSTDTSPQKTPSAIETSLKVLTEAFSSGGKASAVEEVSRSGDDSTASTLFSLLPVCIDCTKGAVVIGNENTRSILTSTWDGATGQVDVKKAGPLDKFKRIFSFDFRHPVIQMKPNPDFKHSQLAAARATTPDTGKPQEHHKPGLHSRYIYHKRRMWNSVRDLIPIFQRSVESFHPTTGVDNSPQSGSRTAAGLRGEDRWMGLSRYLDEEERDDHEGWGAVEYGRFSTVLDCPSLSACYYWDVAGTVSTQRDRANSTAHQEFQNINGAAPPEWGLKLTLNGGMINYGPWADRERASFQSILFPNPRRSARPAVPLAPGQPRQCAKFKLTVDIPQHLTLRIPTREPSKDWQWKGRAEAVKGRSAVKKKDDKNHPRGTDADKSSHGPDIRPFGWFSLLVDGGSAINYEMGMFASDTGFRNTLEFNLNGTKMTSSINHGVLWQSGQKTISCDMFNPLKWNDLHTWNFNIGSQGLDLFLLRDHVHLLTDMMNDWTAGPPTDYHLFSPYQYNIGFSLQGFRLFMNLNDSNIVNNPADTDDNTFLVIQGNTLSANIGIPLLNYRPRRKTVPFDIKVVDGVIKLITPLWNTQRTFMKDPAVGSLKVFALTGTYTYNMGSSPTLTDVLNIDMEGDCPRLYLYGFLIRYFLIIKYNYFGEFQHFKTLDEFKEALNAKESSPATNTDAPSKGNRLDIIIHIRGEKPNLFLPATIYGDGENLSLQGDFLECDVRFTNFYMDIEVFFSPMAAALESFGANGSRTTSATQGIVDGLRIYGHRIFGLPPTEPTYVCNWDFEIGKVIGECTPEFVKCLATAVRFVGFSIDDEENALPPAHPIALHDVVLLRLRIPSISVWVVIDDMAMLVSAGAVNLDFNNWAGSKFSDSVDLDIPNLTFAVVECSSTLQQQGKSVSTKTQAFFETGLNVKKIGRKYDFVTNRALQQQHVRVHDYGSNRTPFLLRPEVQGTIPAEYRSKSKNNPLTMPLPSIPSPSREVGVYKSSASIFSSSWSSRLTTRRDDRCAGTHEEFGDGSGPAASGASAAHGRAHRPGQFPPGWKLHSIQADSDLAPSLPPLKSASERTRHDFNDFELSPELESEHAKQAYVLCELSPGLRGYCSPEAIFMLSSIADKLQPDRPVEIIDALQSRVVSDILGHKKRLSRPKQISTVSLRVPICRVKFLSHSMSPDQSPIRDEIYIELCGIHSLHRKRSETRNYVVPPIESGVAAHTSIDSISLSVQGEVNALDKKAVFNSKLDGFVFWSVSADQKRSGVQVRNLEAETSPHSVEGLALLVHRTKKSSGSIVNSFKQLSAKKTRRLHSLVYSLTQFGSQTSDPLFLTRPSYVLRTANGHLRSNDSWKIVSQLRNIYNSLSHGQQQALANWGSEDNAAWLSDARSFVLHNFDKWRTWDVAHVKKSHVMSLLWALPEHNSANNVDLSAESTSVSIQTLRLSVDSGPKENGLLIEDLSISVDHSSRMDDATSSTSSSIYIQSYCANAALSLKWEICELVESVFKAISRSGGIRKSEGPLREPNLTSSRNKGQDLHIVFVSNRGTIALEGINLKLNLAGEGFKGSIINQRPSDLAAPKALSVLMDCVSSSMDIKSRSSALMLWQLCYPNFFLSRVSESKGARSEHDWKCSAACQHLQYDMMEDPLGLIHVADLVVEDEFKYALGMASTMGSPGSADTASEARDSHNFHISTFLDVYRLRFALLPTVSYSVSGEVASLSVTPTPDLDIEVDFDVKYNRHALESNKESNQQTVSSLVGPPINGRILIDLLHKRTSLDIDITIDPIEVEASAVGNLLSAMNGPEISHFVSDLNHDAQILQRRLARVSSRDSPSPAKKADRSRELVYKLRLTLAGIDIHSSAPGLRNADYSVDLDFKFGWIQLHLENAPKDGTILESPNFNINVHQVNFGLQKRQRGSVRPYGSLSLYARISGTSGMNEKGETIRSYRLSSDELDIELFDETASMMVDIVAHLQKRLKTLDLSHEIERLKKLRDKKAPEKLRTPQLPSIETPDQSDRKKLFDAMYSVELANIQVTWLISARNNSSTGGDTEDLAFSIKNIEVATKRDNAARLRLEDMQLQMIPALEAKKQRSLNSALLPEIIFNVAYLSTNEERRFAFQAAGKALDIRLTSDFILPASILQNSLASASENFREAKALWAIDFPSELKQKKSTPSIKRLGSLLIDSDFAGGMVTLQSRHSSRMHDPFGGRRGQKSNSGGKYGQYAPPNEAATARVQAPGVALKVQFEDTGIRSPTLNAELKVDASSNVLHPSVVPLISQISSSVNEVVGDNEGGKQAEKEKRPEKSQALQETAVGANDPTTILGRCQLNIGLRICKQEFTLSCQPIARVVATARFEDCYVTVNTVQSEEKSRFFAVLIAFNTIQTSIKHVYSSEATASFDIDSIVVSLMNSKHVSTNAGISAILKVSPTRIYGNVKQAQDFLLFREIWMPPGEQGSEPKPADISTPEARAYMVQRYRQVAATDAFPWDSTFAIEKLSVQLDLGQTVGKSDLTIQNLWVSSKKSSDREQNLCFGFDSIAMESKGRFSGLVELSRVKLRTSIMWPDQEPTERQTPLIQASLGFDQLQAKVSFEYQPFLVADVTSFDFLMYNVRDASGDENDRLVSILHGGKFQIFCTALTASQSLGLYQTLQRLLQDKQAAYDTSLKEIESFLRRKATPSATGTPQTPALEATQDKDNENDETDEDAKMPISLHTEVMVSLEAINIGAFPSTFQDGQIFKLEALDAETRFSAAAADGKINGGLGLTLGQLRVGLSSVSRTQEATAEEPSVTEVVNRATGSRGGTILKVPRVVASMETWQTPGSRDIDYIFKSAFEGRVDVGWNYSRISFIRGMWTNHSRALATRLGKPLPKPAVKITGGPKEGEEGEYSGQEKITAVVDVPQSRYAYTALEPPVIETPQLRDMGEATPPLEWIGLHRDKLPNLTHQIIMVTLMEVAKDVEDAYSKILGS